MVPRAPLALERASSQLLFWKPDVWGTSGPFPPVWIRRWRFSKEEKKRSDASVTWSPLSPKFSILLPPAPPSLPAFLGMGEAPERFEDRGAPGSHRPPTSLQLWVCQDFLRRRSSEEGRGGARDSLSARHFLPPFSSPNYTLDAQTQKTPQVLSPWPNLLNPSTPVIDPPFPALELVWTSPLQLGRGFLSPVYTRGGCANVSGANVFLRLRSL